jgi:hypothetical protein
MFSFLGGKKKSEESASATQTTQTTSSSTGSTTTTTTTVTTTDEEGNVSKKTLTKKVITLPKPNTNVALVSVSAVGEEEETKVEENPILAEEVQFCKGCNAAITGFDADVSNTFY